jgi:hypothetical protein
LPGFLCLSVLTAWYRFAGDTMSDVIASILKTDPQPLVHETQAVPGELEHVVSKALRKNPEHLANTSTTCSLTSKTANKSWSLRQNWNAHSRQGRPANRTYGSLPRFARSGCGNEESLSCPRWHIGTKLVALENVRHGATTV